MKIIKILPIILFAFVVANTSAQQNYTIRYLDINTKYSDFGVSLSNDNEVIFSSSSFNDQDRIWSGNKQPYLELLKGTLSPEKEIVGVYKLQKDHINTFHESNAVFTKDGKTVYFTANDEQNDSRKARRKKLIQLYKAEVDDDGVWSNTVKLPFNQDNFQSGHPTLNADDTIMYFVSDRPGSIGGTDMYSIAILPDGSFGEPKNLGPTINTTKNEMFPFYNYKTKQLYFSSEGHDTNYGGLDVFVVELDDKEIATSPVQNLGPPINGAHDDFSFVLKTSENWGFFSSDRREKGNDDLYFFRMYDKDCHPIRGNVRDKLSLDLIAGTSVVLYNSKNEKIESMITTSSGEFSFKVDCNTNETYFVSGTKPSYEIANALVPENKIVSLFLDTLKVDKLYLDPIFFDYDKANIRPDAAIGLEKIISILNRTATSKLKISAYTDSRASNDYNKKLSDRRVQSTIDWLIQRGIAANRLQGIGEGEENLYIKRCRDDVDCSESEHQINRRADFQLFNE